LSVRTQWAPGFLGPPQRLGHCAHDLGGAGEPERPVLAQPVEDRRQAGGLQHSPAELGPLGLECREAVQADLVDLFGRQVGGRVPAHGRPVSLGAARDEADADPVVGAGDRHQFLPQAGQEPPHRGPDLGLDDARGLAAERRAVRMRRQAHGDQRVGSQVLAEVPLELLDGLAHPDLGGNPPVAARLPVAAGDRVEVAAKAAKPLQVAVDGSGVRQQGRRDRLEDHGLRRDVAASRRVALPEAVLEV